MAKNALATGTIKVTVYEDTFVNESGEEILHRFCEMQVSSKTTERFKLKSDSSYELLALTLGNSLKINKPE